VKKTHIIIAYIAYI